MDDDLRQRSEPRLRVLEALVKAQDHLSALVEVVASSADGDAAAVAVAARFGVTPQEAVAILDMQVRRMSQRERAKVVEERDGLRRELSGG